MRLTRSPYSLLLIATIISLLISSLLSSYFKEEILMVDDSFILKNFPIAPPYVMFRFDYPPIAGIFLYFSSLINNMTIYRLVLALVFLLSLAVVIHLLKTDTSPIKLGIWMFLPTFLLLATNSWETIAAVFVFLSVFSVISELPAFSGLFLGLALSSNAYTIFLIPPIILYCKRGINKLIDALIATFLAINVPFAMINIENWKLSYLNNLKRIFYETSLLKMIINLDPLITTALLVGISLILIIIICLRYKPSFTRSVFISLLIPMIIAVSYHPSNVLLILPLISLLEFDFLLFLIFDTINALLSLNIDFPVHPLFTICRVVLMITLLLKIKQTSLPYEALLNLNGLSILSQQIKQIFHPLREILSDDRVIAALLSVICFPLLAYRIWQPNKIYFDEIYYVDQGARCILNRTGDINWIHPPLGKEFIALGIACFSDTAWAWRIFGVLLASISIYAIYFITLKLLDSRKAAILVSLFIILDPLFYTCSRIAMLDVYVFSFSMIAMAFFVFHYFGNKSLKTLYLSGLFYGLAISSKLPGVLPLLLCFLILLIDLVKDRKFKRILHLLVAFILLPAVIYICSYYPTLFSRGYGFSDFLNTQRWMLTYSAYLPPKKPHPYRSQPWEWPLMLRPLLTLFDISYVDNTMFVACICEFGNPLTWFASLIALATTFVDIFMGRFTKEPFIISWLFMTWLPYFPLGIMLYFGAGREMFIFYFLQSLPPFLMILARELKGFDRHVGFNFSTLILIISIIFFIICYPVISGLPVPKAYIDGMKILRL